MWLLSGINDIGMGGIMKATLKITNPETQEETEVEFTFEAERCECDTLRGKQSWREVYDETWNTDLKELIDTIESDIENIKADLLVEAEKQAEEALNNY